MQSLKTKLSASPLVFKCLTWGQRYLVTAEGEMDGVYLYSIQWFIQSTKFAEHFFYFRPEPCITSPALSLIIQARFKTQPVHCNLCIVFLSVKINLPFSSFRTLFAKLRDFHGREFVVLYTFFHFNFFSL